MWFLPNGVKPCEKTILAEALPAWTQGDRGAQKEDRLLNAQQSTGIMIKLLS